MLDFFHVEYFNILLPMAHPWAKRKQVLGLGEFGKKAKQTNKKNPSNPTHKI